MSKDFKYININTQNNVASNNSYLQIPKLCPVCKVAHNPVVSKIFTHEVNSNQLFGFIQRCPNCQKHSFSLNTQHKDENAYHNYNIVLLYPENPNIEFHSLIEDLSPRFVDLYKQSQYCEDKNFVDLAATGYRSALEILIKDYALEFELDEYENIAKQNLNRVISNYFKDEHEALVSADVVRIMGNSFTHWSKDDDASLEEIKYYMEIFLNFIEMKLRIKNPPVSR